MKMRFFGLFFLENQTGVVHDFPFKANPIGRNSHQGELVPEFLIYNKLGNEGSKPHIFPEPEFPIHFCPHFIGSDVIEAAAAVKNFVEIGLCNSDDVLVTLCQPRIGVVLRKQSYHKFI